MNHRVINRGVTVRMITTENRTYRIGTFTMRLVGGQSVFVHCIENAAVNRLESVANVG